MNVAAQCNSEVDDLAHSGVCPNVPVCTFFKAYGNDQRYERELSGFFLLYCLGDRQGRCLRKDAGRRLGAPEKVPANMLPNGLPVSGTDDSEWSEEAKDAAGRRRAVA